MAADWNMEWYDPNVFAIALLAAHRKEKFRMKLPSKIGPVNCVKKH